MDILSDPNNNTFREKSYSLRPRSTVKKEEDDEVEAEDSWKPRGGYKRRLKQKSLPLSKYRRKTANARERSRMREINDAFEALRKALPHFTARNDPANEKTTKIMTLRLAMKYITSLDSALRQADTDSDAESFISDYGMTTPSSLSDNSDMFDQLFVTPPFDDCSLTSISTPRFSHVTSLLNLPLTSQSGSLPSALNKLDSKRTNFDLSNTSVSFKSTSASSVSGPHTDVCNTTLSTTKQTGHHFLNCLHSSDPTHTNSNEIIPDLVKSSVSNEEFVTASWREFDGVPSSPISLDDLFIT